MHYLHHLSSAWKNNFSRTILLTVVFAYEDAWDIEYNDDPVLKLIRFNESVDLSGFDESYCNEEITFTAKVFTPDYFNPGSFSAAIIIETGE